MISHEATLTMFADYLAGKLTDDKMADLESHLMSCESCAMEFENQLNAKIVSGFVTETKEALPAQWKTNEVFEWTLKAVASAGVTANNAIQVFTQFLHGLKEAGATPQFAAARNQSPVSENQTLLNLVEGDPIMFQTIQGNSSIQFEARRIKDTGNNAQFIRIKYSSATPIKTLVLMELPSKQILETITPDSNGYFNIPLSRLSGTSDITFVWTV